VSWNISLAVNFPEFLELSEGRVRLDSHPGALQAAWAFRSRLHETVAGTTGVFPAVLCQELVVVLPVQPKKSPQPGIAFLRTDHLQNKWPLECTVYSCFFFFFFFPPRPQTAQSI